MEFSNGLGDKAIQDVMQTYPEIGEILAHFDIGCTTCKWGAVFSRMWWPSMACPRKMKRK